MAATEQATGGRIVVGVDGSDCSLAALAWAINAAEARGSSVDAVLVWSEAPPPVGVGMIPTTPPTPIERVRQAQLAHLRALVRPVRGRSQVPVRELVFEGAPVRTLRSLAEGADMLVLGSHGYGPVRSTVMGSVSAGCIRHARCPVVVIPRGMVDASRATPAAAEPTVSA